MNLLLLLIGGAAASVVNGPQEYHAIVEMADALVNETMGSLIVGGSEVSPKYKYTHVAGMRSSSSGNSFCGGMLITPTKVLTAGHCLSVNHVSVNTHSRGGTSDGVQRQVRSSTRHPSYNSRTLDYDFAVLTIDAINSGASPVTLASSNGGDETVGKTATVIGWGATREGGASSSVLREVDVDIVSNSQCQSALGGVTNRMICAGGIQGYDACQGDSGGPLFVNKNSNNILVGAVSWGIGCARAGLPGVYARVSSVRSWIDGATNYEAKWAPIDG